MTASRKIILLQADIERLEEIRVFIGNNLGSRLNEFTISQKFAISISTLKRHFGAYFHCSVYKFLLDRRMLEAMRLLEDHQANVQQIAMMVGYTDTSAFSHSFTKYFGYPPAHYLRN